jgi:uncharacterized C2H2 Zn-finger protein
MSKPSQTFLHLSFEVPRSTEANEVFVFSPEGFMDGGEADSPPDKLVYPYPITLHQAISLPSIDHHFALEATDYEDDSIYCSGQPQHRFQRRIKNAEAIARGGRRVVNFVSDGGDGYHALSAATASRLIKSNLTGVELLPIQFDLAEYPYGLPCQFFGLRFVGRPCERIASIVGENRCSQCGQPDLFCARCGNWFFKCPRCNASVRAHFDDPVADDSEWVNDDHSIRYGTPHILDGDRYDGSDFIRTAWGEFVSARAIEWLLENGVRGFSARHCLLAYR